MGVHVHFAQVGVGFRDPGAFGDDGRVQPVLDVGDAGHGPVAADGAADAGLAEDERVGRDGLGRVEGGAGPQAFLAGAGGDDVGGVRHGGVPVPHGASGTCPGMRRPCSCWLMSRCSCSRAGLPGPWRGWHGLHAAEIMYKVRHPHGLHADASPYTPRGRHGAGAFYEYVVVDHGPAGVQAGHALLCRGLP